MKETLFAHANGVHADHKVTISYCFEIIVKMYSPANNGDGIIRGDISSFRPLTKNIAIGRRCRRAETGESEIAAPSTARLLIV